MTTKIALVGNPNSGKTTLFNALTGSNQYVGNWPGVTVEKKEGKLRQNKDIIITDLPGIYSLSPYSPEELIARNYLIDEQPSAILNIVDGSNLERNLFLTTQLTELGIPIVIAVNMMDTVRKNGNKINVEKLSKALGCKIVEISALKGEGIEEAVKTVIEEAANDKTIPKHYFSGRLEHALAHIEEAVLHDLPEQRQHWYAIKLFERDVNIISKLKIEKDKLEHIESDIKACETELSDDCESIIITERYKYIDSIINECLHIERRGKLSTSDKIDRIVTNRFLALPIFVVVMFLIYFISVTTIGGLVTDWANDGVFGEGWNLFGAWIPGIPVLLEKGLNAVNCAEWLQNLLIDGIVAGVGAVLGFVPQLVILFILLAILEGCGYLARVAFIMDKLFRKFGLSGKSFIPILIGTGCGVPGLMASRTIENERDRRMTLITTTFIPCSAKLPIIALIAGALFGGAWWVAPLAYFIGIAAIICSGIILKKTKLFAGEISPFIMELPAYRRPTVVFVFRSMWERAWSFIKKAGTVILLATVVIWFMSNFGWESGSFGMVEMQDSILAKVGSGVSWLFAPLGWGNWEATVATLTGLIAKENLVGVFGVLYNSAGVAESGGEIQSLFAASFTSLSAFSFLVFNLLCAPCFAAIGAIKREMNSKRWFAFAIIYQCAFAYIAALCIFQFGMLFSSGVFGVGTVFAILFTAAFIFMLFCPLQKLNQISEKCKAMFKKERTKS